MRNKIAYIFTIPASILFLIGEKIIGKKVAWRINEVLTGCELKCSKCGHRGKLIDLINDKNKI